MTLIFDLALANYKKNARQNYLKYGQRTIIIPKPRIFLFNIGREKTEIRCKIFSRSTKSKIYQHHKTESQNQIIFLVR